MDSVVKDITQESGLIKLKKEVELLEAVAITLGSIIGSGIFVSPKEVIENSGFLGLALMVWILCGVKAGIGALCYAELGSSIPGSGGEYLYLHVAFGPVPAFLYLWVSTLIFLPVTNAVLALTFAHYIFAAFFLQGCTVPDFAIQLMATSAISFLTWLNCYNVKLTTKIHNVFMFGKIAALTVIIVVGMVALINGHTENYREAWKGSTTDPRKIALAFYSGTFAYSGWNTLNYMTEELKNPIKTLPRAIYISMPIVCTIFVMTNAAYFVVLSPKDIKMSNAIAMTFGEKTLGVMKFIIPIFVAMSSFGGLCVHIMSTSRIIFVGARNGHFPYMFSFIQVSKLSPTPSLVFMAVLSILYLCIPEVFVLINFLTFVFTVTCFSVVIAMLYLRWKEPDLPRPIKINLIYPITFMLICIFLMAFPILVLPHTVLIAIGIILSGLPVYFIFISLADLHPTWFIKIIQCLATTLQKLFLSGSEENEKHVISST